MYYDRDEPHNFKSAWFEVGVPNWLLKLYCAAGLPAVPYGDWVSSFRIDLMTFRKVSAMSVECLLYQGGFLTVKGVGQPSAPPLFLIMSQERTSDLGETEYLLDFPNKTIEACTLRLFANIIFGEDTTGTSMPLPL
jgi:hypothetical protein